MLHRQLDRMHAFFQRPGVTPARVAPWLALAILIPAFLIGSRLEPIGSERAAYDEGPIVVAGGGGGQTQLPGGAGSNAGAVAGVSTSGGGDAGAVDTSGDGGSSGGTAGDAGAALSAPVPEPAFAAPAFVEPAPDPGASQEPPPETDASADPTEAFEGTVVSVNPQSHSYAVATGDQDLVAIHAKKLPKPGDSIRADARPLANGTYEEAERERIDTSASAAFRGWVTWVAQDGLGYTVSVRGASLFVTRSEATEPVPLGAPVLVAVDLDRASRALVQTELTVEGERSDAPLHVNGIIGAIDPEQRTIQLSADDLREAGADLTLAAPEGSIDLTKLQEGDVIDATVVIGADGAYTLTGLSANDDAKAADDPDRAQGDQVEQEDAAATGKWADDLLRSLGIEPAG